MYIYIYIYIYIKQDLNKITRLKYKIRRRFGQPLKIKINLKNN